MNGTLANSAWMWIAAATADDKAYQVGYAVGRVAGTLFVLLILVGVPIFCIVAFVQYARTKKQGWLISGIVTAAISLVVALMMVGFVFVAKGVKSKLASQYTQDTAPVPTDRLVKFAEGTAQLQLAPHWQTLTNLNNRAAIQVGNPVREEYLMVLIDQKSDYSGSVTNYASLASKDILNRLQGGKATELQSLNLHSHPTLQCEMSGTISGVKIEYLLTVMEGKERFYRILAWTLPSKKPAAFKVFREVLQTCDVE